MPPRPPTRPRSRGCTCTGTGTCPRLHGAAGAPLTRARVACGFPNLRMTRSRRRLRASSGSSLSTPRRSGTPPSPSSLRGDMGVHESRWHGTWGRGRVGCRAPAVTPHAAVAKRQRSPNGEGRQRSATLSIRAASRARACRRATGHRSDTGTGHWYRTGHSGHQEDGSRVHMGISYHGPPARSFWLRRHVQVQSVVPSTGCEHVRCMHTGRGHCT